MKPMKGQDRNKTLSGPGPSSNIVVTNKAVEQRLKTKGYTPTGAQVDDLVLARWVRSLPHDPSGRKVGTKRLGFSSGQGKRRTEDVAATLRRDPTLRANTEEKYLKTSGAKKKRSAGGQYWLSGTMSGFFPGGGELRKNKQVGDIIGHATSKRFGRSR